MGFFGGVHNDKRDAPAEYSAMIANSDVPEDYDKGCFHLLEIGCHIYLDTLVIAHFSGLRIHGGTPPTAPDGVQPVPWAYRWIVILYPSRSMVEGEGLQALAAMPDHSPFTLRPEMTELV
jgi:hypothetical protein